MHLVIEAQLATQTLRWLQLDSSFEKTYFLKLMLLQILLFGVKIGCKMYVGSTQKAMQSIIIRKRTLKLVETYLNLPYSQQAKDSIRSRFRQVIGEVGYSPDVFENTLTAVGEAVDTCVILAVAGASLLKTSSLGALTLAAFTSLYIANAVCSVKRAPENHGFRWSSAAERRAATLSDFPVDCRASPQDLRLYGSRNWLLSELRAAVEKIPLRKEDIPPTNT